MLNSPEQTTRTKRLKALTNEAHDKLDKRILAAEPFANRHGYSLFVKMQYHFHRDIDALYSIAMLAALLPDLESRRRLDLIKQDLKDINQPISLIQTPPVFERDANTHEALGWLYVSEGSNLGAAFLLKFAADIGLNEDFGARHLAAHPEGRGKHWRAFTTMLDGLDLSDDEEQKIIDGGVNAFKRIHALVDEIF